MAALFVPPPNDTTTGHEDGEEVLSWVVIDVSLFVNVLGDLGDGPALGLGVRE